MNLLVGKKLSSKKAYKSVTKPGLNGNAHEKQHSTYGTVCGSSGEGNLRKKKRLLLEWTQKKARFNQSRQGGGVLQ